MEAGRAMLLPKAPPEPSISPDIVRFLANGELLWPAGLEERGLLSAMADPGRGNGLVEGGDG